MKKTLIIGASPNPERYSYKAAHMLKSKGHSIINVGIKKGAVAGEEIEQPGHVHNDIDTVTLYIGPHLQSGYFNYILETKPKRVIFNPGAENQELEELLLANDIEPIEACTLVLLATGQF